MRRSGPSVLMEKFCEATWSSSYKKQGRNLPFPSRHWAPFVRPLRGLGIKKRHLGKSCGVRFNWRLVLSVWDDALWVCNCRSVFLLAFECLWKRSRLTSECIIVSGVNFIVMTAENFVSPLFESSPSPHKQWKKNVSVAEHKSFHPSENSPTLPSSFFLN